MRPVFHLGVSYTAEQIASALGCGLRQELRQAADHTIVAACLDPRKHPRAPHELWVGDETVATPQGQLAQQFIAQCAADPAHAVALFIRDRTAGSPAPPWMYRGRYRVAGQAHDVSPVLADRPAHAPRWILHLERVSD